MTTILDVAAIKADFPLLKREVHGRPIVYLDSAATSQKPHQVLDALNRYYEEINANIHRGAYHIAEQATTAVEDSRAALARFVGAPEATEIVFAKNATEAINLVAQSWGRTNLSSGDIVLLSAMEHHANIVPWQQLAAERGVEVRWIPVGHDGRLDFSDLDRLLDGVRLVAVSAASNVLGTLPPIRWITEAAHAVGALCLVDASQWVPHQTTDVTAWNCDLWSSPATRCVGPRGSACCGGVATC